MQARTRKNIIALINIALFIIVLLIGIMFILSGDRFIGWMLALIAALIIIFSVMSLLKRKKEDSFHK